jgi:hypothetical protein
LVAVIRRSAARYRIDDFRFPPEIQARFRMPVAGIGLT